jgi:hypothetical protein
LLLSKFIFFFFSFFPGIIFYLGFLVLVFFFTVYRDISISSIINNKILITKIILVIGSLKKRFPLTKILLAISDIMVILELEIFRINEEPRRKQRGIRAPSKEC